MFLTPPQGGVRFMYIDGLPFWYHHKRAFVKTYAEIFEKGIYTFTASRPDPIIIDCGANMGLSVLFFSRQYPGATIYAFEPDKAVLPVLQKNIETFGLQRVQLHQKAVWSHTGTLDFFTDGGLGGRLREAYSKRTPTTVETVRLKDFIGDKQVDFLKMDIEGAEYPVLMDCASVLPQIAHVFIEYHSTAGAPQHLDDILSMLKQHGFRYHLTHSFSRTKPFVEEQVICERFDMAVNIFGYRVDQTAPDK